MPPPSSHGVFGARARIAQRDKSCVQSKRTGGGTLGTFQHCENLYPLVGKVYPVSPPPPVLPHSTPYFPSLFNPPPLIKELDFFILFPNINQCTIFRNFPSYTKRVKETDFFVNSNILSRFPMSQSFDILNFEFYLIKQSKFKISMVTPDGC